MKPQNFVDGDGSQKKAATAFSTIGFTSTVPREEDHFVVDIFVHIGMISDEGISPSGYTFNTQVKSNPGTVIFNKHDQITSFLNSHIPYFVTFIHDGTIEIYSTLSRFMYTPDKFFNTIHLHPNKERKNPYISNKTLHINMNTAIARFKLDDLDPSNPDNKNNRELLSRLLGLWTYLEMNEIAFRTAKIPWIQIPPNEVKTNELPPIDDASKMQWMLSENIDDFTSALNILGLFINGSIQLIKENITALPETEKQHAIISMTNARNEIDSIREKAKTKLDIIAEKLASGEITYEQAKKLRRDDQ